MFAAATVLFLAAVLPPASTATAAPIDRFVGQWVGMGITENGAPAEGVGFIDRDLEVAIEATAEGFNVTWITLRPSKGSQADKVKQSSISVPFVHVGRPGIYRMATTSEPLSGSPYIWALVSGPMLEVHSITISGRGVLEYQKYIRTLLSDDEMQLRFTRSLDGSIVRSVLAHLRRQ
jgi:hypothetical protein